MAMTQRERYLAIGVASIAGIVGVQYMYSTVRDGLDKKQRLIDNARSQVETLDQTINQGMIDSTKLEALAEKSLPSDSQVLLADYTTWLTDIGKSSGVDGLSVRALGQPRFDKVGNFTAYSFELVGTAKTDQVIDLLAKFYDKDYLHTLDVVQVDPIPRTRDVFRVTLKSRALALKIAAPDQEPSEQPSGRLQLSPEEYKEAVLARNPFSPPNNAPDIKTSSSLEITLGDNRWNKPLEAEDTEGHGIEWSLVGDAPEGARLRNGTLYFSPTEVGEFDVTVQAKDKGWPSMSQEKKIRLVVKEPAKEVEKVEPPKFDAATQAFVSAIVSGQKGPQACIRSLTESQPYWVAAGDDLEVGTIKAKVISISVAESFVELQSDEIRWTVGMDSSLAESFAKSQVD